MKRDILRLHNVFRTLQRERSLVNNFTFSYRPFYGFFLELGSYYELLLYGKELCKDSKPSSFVFIRKKNYRKRLFSIFGWTLPISNVCVPWPSWITPVGFLNEAAFLPVLLGARQPAAVILQPLVIRPVSHQQRAVSFTITYMKNRKKYNKSQISDILWYVSI